MHNDPDQPDADKAPTEDTGAEDPSTRHTSTRDRSGNSELEEGLDHLGKAVGGVLTRLLGSRYTQVEVDPEKPVLGPEADAAIERAGEKMGRWLKAAGEGLHSHPTDPIAALDHAAKHKSDQVEVREGEAPLAAGMRALAGGLYRSTEAVLDVVAPRKPKPGAEGDNEGDAGSDEVGPVPDEE